MVVAAQSVSMTTKRRPRLCIASLVEEVVAGRSAAASQGDV